MFKKLAFSLLLFTQLLVAQQKYASKNGGDFEPPKHHSYVVYPSWEKCHSVIDVNYKKHCSAIIIDDNTGYIVFNGWTSIYYTQFPIGSPEMINDWMRRFPNHILHGTSVELILNPHVGMIEQSLPKEL